jgi:plasmid replication initiation protein
MSQAEIEAIQRRVEEIKSSSRRNAEQPLELSLSTDEEDKDPVCFDHPQQDFFLNTIFDAALKDDHASMEHPIFSLSKIPDQEIRRYEHNGNKVTVTPSVTGIATIWDKDILLFAISSLVEAQNRGQEINRTIRLQAIDLLLYCHRGLGGADYDNLIKALERLAGTRIKTDIHTNGKRERQGFGLIESWSIVERTSSKRMAGLEITLSEWLFNAVVASEVLTLSHDYFRLRKGLERRLYELSRKHCGRQSEFAISLETLFKKSGARCTLKEFRRQVREIVQKDSLPDYALKLDKNGKNMTINLRLERNPKVRMLSSRRK